ncbi:MAG TPA: transporter substrate-binding domain-containing protein [Candidatus Eubacterium faecigallinarum]|nr:transporter substrate-binding domain-containing protein [Candidatus Eubacterium faecigallinarum]
MKKVLSVFLAALMMISVVSLFAACSKDTADKDTTGASDAATAESDLAYVQDKGTLVVGITEYEPMNYMDENGEWTGFDTEFARAVGEKLGVNVEFVEINWDYKYNELDSKSIDCIWNGMTITDEGKEAASISDPYAENAQVVVMKQDQLANYTDVESLKDLTIAVEGGSAGEKAAAAAGLTNTVVSNTQALALTEVSSGSCDACIIDLTMANSMTGEGTSNANLGFELKLEAEEYGIAFRKNSDLTAKVNEIIDELMSDGTLDALAEKYEISLIK